MDEELGQRIQTLRKRCGLSVRQLADQSALAPDMVIDVERGKTSPNIATLQKILAALGTNIAGFFGGRGSVNGGPVFTREGMRMVNDDERSYTIIFPRKREIRVEMMDAMLHPSVRRPPFETLGCDVAGYVIAGTLILEFGDESKQRLRPGDAFYVPQGQEHRSYAMGDEAVRVVTTYAPPHY